MKLIIAYFILIALFVWQAVRNGFSWWTGIVAFFFALAMLVIGDAITSIRIYPRPKQAKPLKENISIYPRSKQAKPLKENIPVYQGEVLDDYPALPAPQEKTGGVFFAVPMWCDKCKHYPLHIHINGQWVCQCPWHGE